MKWVVKKGKRIQYEVSITSADHGDLKCGFSCWTAIRSDGKVVRASLSNLATSLAATEMGMQWLYESLQKSYPDTRPTLRAAIMSMESELVQLKLKDRTERLAKAQKDVEQYLVEERGA